MTVIRLSLCVALLDVCAASSAAQSPPSYAKHVRPILTRYCVECHNAKESEGGLSLESVKTLMEAALILLFVYFVWLAARQRRNWPRWALTAALVLSGISVLQIVGETGLQFDTSIEIVSCALTAAGLYFSFTGDAVGWFNA